MTIRASALLALACNVAFAQQPPPAFDAASLKLSTPQSQRGAGGGPGTTDPRRYVFRRAGLGDLISEAWRLQSFQIAGKLPPDEPWYDLIAKVPTGATRDQFRVMLQNLLAERFHLKFHIEKRDFAGYELRLAKSGIKLKEYVPDSNFVVDSRFPDPGPQAIVSRRHASEGYVIQRMVGRQVTPADIATEIGIEMEGEPPIPDKTGLTAKYDFTLEYARELPSAAHEGASQPPAIPDLFIALQQQLGLQLVRQKSPFDVLVIDAVDPTPTGN